MKAKRLLSAFLAVAMMLTTLVALGTVTYAYATTPVAPCTPKFELKFVKMTAEELATVQTDTGCTMSDGSTAYWLVGTLDDYGTWTCTEDVTCGRKLDTVDVLITFDKNITEYFEYSAKIQAKLLKYDKGEIGTCTAYQNAFDDKQLAVNFAPISADETYPMTKGTSKTGLMTWVKIPMYVKSDFTATIATLEVDESTYDWGWIQEGTAFRYKIEEGNDEVYEINPVSLTVSVESTPVVADPVIKDVVVNGTDGVAIIGQDAVKYDNALSVTASFENVSSITGAGVLFIPSTVLGDNTLTAETANVANAYKLGAGGGDGTLTVKAAIKDIPRALQGTNIQFVTRPYILKDTAYAYGTQGTTTVNFGNTGEIAD